MAQRTQVGDKICQAGGEAVCVVCERHFKHTENGQGCVAAWLPGRGDFEVSPAKQVKKGCSKGSQDNPKL